METKIRVYGKSQSRTALGIINAYLKLYPDSTISDLRQAFPKSLNPKSFTDSLLVPLEETKGNEKLFFEREDEMIVLKNGKKYALVELWQKEHFDAICEHAKQYGIEAAEIAETKPFQKGSYELEYLHGFIPPEELNFVAPPVADNPEPKKKNSNWLWWLLLLLLLLLIALFCLKKCCCGNKCPTANTPAVTVAPAADSLIMPKGTLDSLNNVVYDTGDTVTVTLPDGKEWRIGQNSSEYKLFTFLNSDVKVDTADKSKGWITLDRLRFNTGSSTLTPESDDQLKNIAMILKFFPNSQIKLGGYTDNTGTEDINMKLSNERAKVTADKLISLGIDKNRVAYEGYGPQHPVCPANDTDFCRALNRRIDVRVTHK
jgi:outer membrane protein OmpA-like peptidoglycan-associated protein